MKDPINNIFKTFVPLINSFPNKTPKMLLENSKPNTNRGRLIINIHFTTCLLISLTSFMLLRPYSLLTSEKNNCINNSGIIAKKAAVVTATLYIPTISAFLK